MTSLVGREEERARLTALLGRAREDRSGVLLLQGPAGIGKTALLRWATSEAEGSQILRARGMESESDIPFAGLASWSRRCWVAPGRFDWQERPS